MKRHVLRCLQLKSNAAASVDGRLQRSKRSRQLIADALFDLLGEGNLAPSAQQVADRAGVGLRTVFRLYADVDELYATINARLQAEVAPLLLNEPPIDAALSERALSLVDTRALVFERYRNYLCATQRNRGRSAFLAAQYRALVRTLRSRLLLWLPELCEAPHDLVEAVDLATSFDAWERLRGDQRLSQRRARSVLRRTVLALLDRL